MKKKSIFKDMQEKIGSKFQKENLRSEDLNIKELEITQMRNEIIDLIDDLNNKKQQIKSIEKNLKIKNSIINDLTDQLIDKHLNILENNQMINLKNKNIEIESKIKEIKTLENGIIWLKSELNKTRDEINIKNLNLEKRNKIIEELTRQLTVNQTRFLEKSHEIRTLQNNLNEKKNELLNKEKKLLDKNKYIVYQNNVLEKKNNELLKFENEIKKELDLESLTKTLCSRNKIIEDLNNQIINSQILNLKRVNENETLKFDLEKVNIKNKNLIKKLNTVNLELENNQNNLKSLFNQLQIRNSIIKELEMQLSKNQMVRVETNNSIENLHNEIMLKQNEIDDLNKKVKDANVKLRIVNNNKDSTLEFKSELKKDSIEGCMNLDDKRFIAGDLEIKNQIDDKKILKDEKNSDMKNNINDELEEKICFKENNVPLKPKKIKDKDFE